MTETRKAITRADVARLAEVSPAVVSYVLTGSARPVSAAARARVLAAVDALGYRPNAAARALSRGRSSLIGFIVPDQRNPYFAGMVALVDRAARTHGLTVLILSAHERRAGVEEIEGLTAQQLEGIISADALTAHELRVIEHAGTPLVYLNQFGAQPDHPTLGTDYVAGARLAVDHLISLGHRHIAFIGSDPQLDPREAGWRRALADAGLPAGPVFRSEWSLEGGYAAGLQLAEHRADVTAVFVASDQVATGAMAALHARGVLLPDDMSVVGFDGTPEAAYTWPALTSVTQSVEDMTRDAVAMLAAGQLRPVFRDYPATLLVRASTAPPRA